MRGRCTRGKVWANVEIGVEVVRAAAAPTPAAPFLVVFLNLLLSLLISCGGCSNAAAAVARALRTALGRRVPSVGGGAGAGAAAAAGDTASGAGAAATLGCARCRGRLWRRRKLVLFVEERVVVVVVVVTVGGAAAGGGPRGPH
jgi:hypothetical protein